MKGETVISLKIGAIVVLTSVVVGLITGATTYAFTYGYFQRDREARIDKDRALENRINELHHIIEVLDDDCKEYTDLEVGGLRADWERELKYHN